MFKKKHIPCCIIVVIIFCTCCLEVYFQKNNFQPFHIDKIIDRNGFRTYRKNINWWFEKNFFQMNEYGLRGSSFSPQKESDEIRIVLLGTCFSLGFSESTTEGFSITRKEIKTFLERKYPEFRFTIINAGIPLNDEFQSLVLFLSLIKNFQPDFVILELGTSQILEPVRKLKEYRQRIYLSDDNRSPELNHFLNSFFQRSIVISYLYKLRSDYKQFFINNFYKSRYRKRANKNFLQDYRCPQLKAREGSSNIATRHKDFVDNMKDDILKPSSEFYRSDLVDLLSVLKNHNFQVMTFTFPHWLPVNDLLSQREKGYSDEIVLKRSMGELRIDGTYVLELFNYAYSRIDSINREVSEKYGARYVDLMKIPGLKEEKQYHSSPGLFWAPLEDASALRAKKLSETILNHYTFLKKSGKASIVKKEEKNGSL